MQQRERRYLSEAKRPVGGVRDEVGIEIPSMVGCVKDIAGAPAADRLLILIELNYRAVVGEVFPLQFSRKRGKFSTPPLGVAGWDVAGGDGGVHGLGDAAAKAGGGDVFPGFRRGVSAGAGVDNAQEIVHDLSGAAGGAFAVVGDAVADSDGALGGRDDEQTERGARDKGVDQGDAAGLRRRKAQLITFEMQ